MPKRQSPGGENMSNLVSTPLDNLAPPVSASSISLDQLRPVVSLFILIKMHS